MAAMVLFPRQLNMVATLLPWYLLILQLPAIPAPTIHLERSKTATAPDFTTRKGSCNTVSSRDIVLDHTKQPSSLVFRCPFTANPVTTCIRHGKACLGMSWNCTISNKKVCDGYSQCHLDECGKDCNTSVIYCPGVGGCVSMAQACDGIADCPGGEDERACEGAELLTCIVASAGSRRVNLNTSPTALCRGALFYGLTTRSCERCYEWGAQVISPIDICYEILGYLPKFSPTSSLQEECRKKCNVTKELCGLYRSGNPLFPMMSLSTACLSGDYLLIDSLCDGVIDCPDRSDEKFCPDRFYCSVADAEWVEETKVCDGHMDCKTGLDECNTCARGAFSSDERIIRHTSSCGLCILVVLLIIGTNIYNLLEITYSTADADQHIVVDRFLKIALIVHDILMGVYLACLLVANFWFYGRYCQFDTEWRTGASCHVLGVLFSVSSHGSLLTVLLMSITRAYKCTRPLSEGFPKSAVYIVSGLLILLNIAHATIPLAKIGVVQEVFRNHIQIPNTNPFLEKQHTNLSRISEIHAVFFGNSSTADFYDKVQDLKSITNTPGIFDVQSL
eukprot:sb/3463522/